MMGEFDEPWVIGKKDPSERRSGTQVFKTRVPHARAGTC